MARFTLNIYGENDELIKVHQTDHVRWGLLIRALDLQERIADAQPEEQMKAINQFALELFPGMTEEELCMADGIDVMNVLTQVGRMAGKINGKNV